MKLKKTLLGLLALAAGLPMSTSCSDDNDRILPYEYIAVQESKDGNWSFYGPDGTLRYRNEYKNRPSNVVDGYFFVREGDTTAVTLYKMDKNPRRIDAVAHVLRIGYMGSGLVPVVREEQRITLVDGEGDVKFTLNPIGGKEVICCAPRFEDGMLAIAVVDKNGRRIWGYAGTNGQTGIRPRFTDANDFRDGVAICCTSEKTYGDEAKYVIINKKGETVKSLNKGVEPISSVFESGRIPVSDTDGRVLMLDKKGETVTKLPAKAKGVKDWNKKYVVFADENDNYGVMDFEGEVVIRPKYDRIEIIGSDRFLAKEINDDDCRSFILDKDGEEELRIDNYKHGARWYCQFGLVGRDKNTETFLEDDGKARKNAEFYSIGGKKPYKIFSDYFNAEAAISEIVNLINDKGVDKYIIGGTPADQLSNLNPEDYSYKCKAVLDNLAKAGDNWELTASATYQGGDLSDYNYNYNDDSRYYFWNPYARLARIDLNIRCDKWDATECEALTKALVNKGFTKESSTGSGNKQYCALLTKGDLAVIIYYWDVVVCQNNYSNREKANQIISDYDTNPDSNADYNEPAVSYEYEAPADSVAVDSVA